MHLPTLRSALVSAGYLRSSVLAVLSAYAKAKVLEILRDGIIVGHLTIVDESVPIEIGAQDGAGRSVTLTVLNADLWTRVILSSDLLGIAEAYTQGDYEVSSLSDFFNLWLDNRKTLHALSTSISSIFTQYSALAIRSLGWQSLSMARRNVEAAYDTSNIFFQCFLSAEMMYSCALWGEAENGVRGDLTVGPTPGDLEAAQQRKITTVLAKARAALLGCTVDTLTLSEEQADMARQRAREAGVQDRVSVHLCNYRQMPSAFEHAFDALVTSEMIEHVGSQHLNQFFRIMDWALKPDRATMVITATSQPEHRHRVYQPDDFARHYHWPNARKTSTKQ
ncbi:S-adenosyl-L-methionine-dependent methyltransferase [Punctularia strigosozonata HHB-11173 SS5]|uniref:S-adenosyl-L-methionine-dependent methyltransferase n=1 Tax=Punctularia strigosozonata (strain HHB-11173) TaxID=741275 RepID=UPI000441626D|nr:S-adenosyl-L-methionine-dependent methyltransferase [Punctularia strigosozonata HHB-11173 SS5]EIN07709.1 S-adenosyl-L-methionine-dependent methyltransferase [Punctularia strigosozonata HHB-11173 SS5]